MSPDTERKRALDLNGKTILVTGATGSFGNAFVARLLRDHDPQAIRVFSRDELKQYDMQRAFADEDRLRFLIGDVRDRDRLVRATRGVDVIVHAAALKHVGACEYNPFEAVQTNVMGAENIVAAAIENEVPLTVALSTDKAVNPVNLYGATKLCEEKITVQGNAYAAGSPSRFACVRYGNVVGSRGSVVPLFKAQAETGVITVTDDRMTRYWITLDGAVDLVLHALDRMGGGEIYIPKIPSARIGDIAEAVAPDCEKRVIGIRPGEKLHEVLVTEDESRHAYETDETYVIMPEHASWELEVTDDMAPLEGGFRYASDTNTDWLSVDQLRVMSEGIKAAA
jgi:UDP-N-acetylglucosamine 4,6-dehydratase